MANWLERARICLQVKTPKPAEIAETSKKEESAVSAETNRRSMRGISGCSATKQYKEKKDSSRRFTGSQEGAPTYVFRDKRSLLGDQLAAESRRRVNFCLIHRRMLGGHCSHLDSRNLNGCLLWQIILAEPELEKISEVEVLPGISMSNVLTLLSGSSEPKGLFIKDRRWILAFSAIARGDRDPLLFF